MGQGRICGPSQDAHHARRDVCGTWPERRSRHCRFVLLPISIAAYLRAPTAAPAAGEASAPCRPLAASRPPSFPPS
eukprot:344545-Chlamydomonas_euryale.AAC.1